MIKYEKIIKYMRRKSISKYGLAKLTGISESLIGRYLRGKTDPSTGNLKKIASILNMDVRELI